jgi:hypothetical protein
VAGVKPVKVVKGVFSPAPPSPPFPPFFDPVPKNATVGWAFHVTVFRGGRKKAGKGGEGGVFPVFRLPITAFTTFSPFFRPGSEKCHGWVGVSRDSFPKWPKKKPAKVVKAVPGLRKKSRRLACQYA